MPVIHVNKSARGPFGTYLQVHNHDQSLDKLKIKLQVYASENPGVVISLEFNNYSFPTTFTGHIFGMRKNI